ncbi:MAG: alpha/beta fold hydrolase [Dehalococcoidales bacterium]|nr:MAG: alpha/beta fold hydrolase [Dehalococcoidales bacterium]
MPEAKNNNTNIYYEVEGEGPPLVLHHGFAGSLEDWREFGYTDSLKSEYQLIMLDARGHGKSDKPHDPRAYSIENRVKDVIAVLDDVKADTAHFFGYSYGGRLAFELALYTPKRMESFIVSGIGARGQNPDFLQNRIKNLENGPEGLLKTFEQFGELSHQMHDRLLQNDCEALIAILQTPWPYRGDALQYMKEPFLLLGGEFDPGFTTIEDASERLPDSTFIPLSGLNHMQTAIQIDKVLPHIKNFLARVSKKQ